MREKFGADYAAYMGRTRRWLLIGLGCRASQKVESKTDCRHPTPEPDPNAGLAAATTDRMPP